MVKGPMQVLSLILTFDQNKFTKKKKKKKTCLDFELFHIG
jgi:hypothetical protein